MSATDQELSFLFSRLTWPSGMVRERACVAIANLLIDSSWSETVRRHLMRWMEARRLESVSAIGLLVLLRAKIQDSGFVIQPIEEFSSILHRPSVLSWILMNELVPRHIPSPNWSTFNSDSAPKDFKPETFFTKYSRNFLPPIYTDLAEKIQARGSIPFVTQWAFEWRKILERIGRRPSKDSLAFSGRENSEHYAAIDFELSEVYRSAYLRTLAWGIMVGALSENDAGLLAIKTCPIDLGLWRLRPISKPAFWPKAYEPEGRIDAVPTQIWKRVEALWEKECAREDDWTIAEANGRVHEGSTIYDLEIYGLFQICQGPSIPNFEGLTDWYRWRNDVKYAPCNLLLEGVAEPTSPDTLAQSFADWDVVPVACRVSPCGTPRWQFWRVYRDIWLPEPFLSSNQLRFQCLDDTLIFRNGDDIVGKWNDWTFNLKEKMTANLPPSTGQYLLIQRERIETFAAKTDSVFCWICRLIGYHRKHDYEPFEHFADYRQYGASSIART